MSEKKTVLFGLADIIGEKINEELTVLMQDTFDGLKAWLEIDKETNKCGIYVYDGTSDDEGDFFKRFDLDQLTYFSRLQDDFKFPPDSYELEELRSIADQLQAHADKIRKKIKEYESA